MSWTSAGAGATTRKLKAGRMVLVGNVKSATPERRKPLRSAGTASELYSSMNSRFFPSGRGCGWNMASEMTRPVRRLDGPSGSIAPRTVKATKPKRAGEPKLEHGLRKRRIRHRKLKNGDQDFIINSGD